MNIRKANSDDRDLFLALMHDHLVEMRSKGSAIRPTAKSLAFYAGLFDAYVSKALKGVVFVCDDQAFTIAGESGVELDSDLSPQAIGWGTHVAPALRRKGVASVLRRELVWWLKDNGFRTLVGSVQEGDTAAIRSLKSLGQVVWHQRTGFVRL